MVDVETITRPLPHSVEAERAVLGALLLDNRHLDLARQQLDASHFYAQAHRLIFEAVSELFNLDKPVDLVTLRSELERRGALEGAGGADYLASLTDGVPRSLNLPHYIAIVRDKALLRELIQISNTAINACLQDAESAQTVLDDVERKVFNLAEGFIQHDYVSAGALTDSVLRETEDRAQRKSPLTGLPTGFADLDQITGGLQPGELIVVAARPGMGKSTFCLNLAANASCRYGKHVAFFSLEDSRERLVQRLLCITAEVNADKVSRGQNVSRDDWTKLGLAASKLKLAPFYIDDNPSTILEIKTKARRIKREHELDLMVVDYLQLIPTDKTRYENRTLEIAAYTQALKNMSKELRVPVIVVSQLNRSIEQRLNNSRPRLSDLRESGAIEQDADIVCFLFRMDSPSTSPRRRDGQNRGGNGDGIPPYDGDEPIDSTEGVRMELIIAKHRNGPVGDLPFVFFQAQTRFQTAVPTSEEARLSGGTNGPREQPF